MLNSKLAYNRQSSMRRTLPMMLILVLGLWTNACVTEEEGAEEAAYAGAALPTPVLEIKGDAVCSLCGSCSATSSVQGYVGTADSEIVTTPWGQGFRFNGSATNSRVEFPNHWTVNRGGQVTPWSNTFTVAAWVKPENINGVQAIANRWYALDNFNLALNNGRPSFSIAQPGGTWGVAKTITASAPLAVNQWHLIVGTISPTSICVDVVDNYARVSRACQIQTFNTYGGWQLQSSNRPLVIGNHPAWNAFVGTIDNVRVYHSALSTAQVQAIWENDNIVPTTTASALVRTRNGRCGG